MVYGLQGEHLSGSERLLQHRRGTGLSGEAFRGQARGGEPSKVSLLCTVPESKSA